MVAVASVEAEACVVAATTEVGDCCAPVVGDTGVAVDAVSPHAASSMEKTTSRLSERYKERNLRIFK